MSKMACLCGSVISNTLCPCPSEGWILRDEDQECYYDTASRDIAAFFAAIHSGRRIEWIADYFSPQYPSDESDESDETVIYDIIAHHRRQIVLALAECEKCGRLWIQCEPDVNQYRSYSPDEPGYAGVLQSPKAKSFG